MRDRLKSLLKHTDMTEKRAFTVNVHGCACFVGDSLERDFLAVETTTAVFKVMHSGNYSWKRKTGTGSRIWGGYSASSPGAEVATVSVMSQPHSARSTLQN
jgi:hypothetical protein